MFYDPPTTSQRLELVQSGNLLWRGVIHHNEENDWRDLVVPLQPINPGETVVLDILTPDAHAPKHGRDRRQLGIALKTLEIRR